MDLGRSAVFFAFFRQPKNYCAGDRVFISAGNRSSAKVLISVYAAVGASMESPSVLAVSADRRMVRVRGGCLPVGRGMPGACGHTLMTRFSRLAGDR